MLTDAISWVFHSPRRLAVTAVTILAVVLIGGSALFGSTFGTGTRSDARPAQQASQAAQVPDAQPYVDAAVNFVKLWSTQAKGQSTNQWQARLAPLTTPDFGEALLTTNTAELPDSPPSGDPVVRYVADTSALVAVPLESGSSVLVTLVSTDRQMLVSDVQPNVGD